MHPATENILQHFTTEHLLPELAAASEPFGQLARDCAAKYDGPELTAGLRKLLEAKDCMVRASLVRFAAASPMQPMGDSGPQPAATGSWVEEPTPGPVDVEPIEPDPVGDPAVVESTDVAPDPAAVNEPLADIPVDDYPPESVLDPAPGPPSPPPVVAAPPSPPVPPVPPVPPAAFVPPVAPPPIPSVPSEGSGVEQPGSSSAS